MQILDIHIMFNWQLPYQEIRWPVSRDYFAGSGLELIKVACFFKFTADQVLVLDWIVGSCQVNLLEKKGRIVRKSLNANQVNSFFYTNAFAALFCVYGDH